MGYVEDMLERLKEAFPETHITLSRDKRKYRADFGDDIYVDIHITKEEEDFAIHYQRKDGCFMRWNNAHDPKNPHIHTGKVDVEEKIYKDLYSGDINKIIEVLKIIKKLEDMGEL